MVRIRLPLPLKNRIRLLCGFLFRPVGQAVKTSPFHGGIMGSIPVRVTRRKSPEWLYKAVRGILYFRKSSFDHCLIIILRCLIFIGCRFALQVGIRVAFRATISPDFQHIGNWVQVHFPSKNIYGSAFLILGIMSILPNIVGSLRPVQKFGSSGALLEGGCAWWFGRIGRDYRL